MRHSATGLVMAGMCMVVLASGPTVAHAQGYPENTPQACSDRIDNDGDGYVDCYDADCAQFCRQQPPPPNGYVAPPPPNPEYAPPPPPPPVYGNPPPVYVNPPPVYYAPRPIYVQPMYVQQPMVPQPGIGTVIGGFVFLGLGVGFLAGGGYLLDQACSRPTGGVGFGAGCFDGTGSYYGWAWGGTIMVTFGSIFTILSLILIPVGFVKQARYNRWRDAQQQRRRSDIKPYLEPSASGLTLRF